MIDPALAVAALRQAGVSLFTGVPDSLLREINTVIDTTLPASAHIPASNEGGAIGIAAGHHLSTGELAVVYLQNSGLGNAVNPLISLASPEVYGLPMVLMIGWRGQPGVSDEPQHLHQGRVTEEMLHLLDVPIKRLTAETANWEGVIASAVSAARERQGPVALLVSAGTFGKYHPPNSDQEPQSAHPLRSEAISVILDVLPTDTFYVATTGYTARELAALRLARGEQGARDFLVVGSMGHAGSIALGMALSRPEVSVVCLDGDGSLAMHLGVIAAIGFHQPANLGHVLLNNGVHESVGGQPSTFRSIDAVSLALACGYRTAESSASVDDLATRLERIAGVGPWFIEIKIRQGTLPELPRPDDFRSRLQRLRSEFQS